ncbi:MAG: BamA/TamA family outer membrane protein [Gemmatimonadaceae bacterium]
MSVARAVLIVLLLTPPGGVSAQERRPLITSVVLKGVHAVPVDELRAGLVTQPTRCRSVLYAPFCLFSRSPVLAVRNYLDAEELKRDVLRVRLFYWRRGYRAVTVQTHTERAKGGTRVIFAITEGQPTTISRLTVTQPDSVLPPRVIREALSLKAGDPLDLVSLDSARTLLYGSYWERGYSDATVDVDTSAVSVDSVSGPVVVQLQSGRRSTVRETQIEGTARISAETINRLMHLAPGDLFRRQDIFEAQRRLYLSGLFSEAEVVPIPTTDSAKTLMVRVVEAPFRRVKLSGGVTTADFAQVDAEFTRYHFLSGARRLTAHLTVSNLLAPQLNGSGVFYDVTGGAEGRARDPFLEPTWSASLEFLQPWAFSPRNQLGASLFTHRRSQPGVVTDRGAGFTLGVTRETTRRSSATLAYTYESSSIDASDVYFCVSVGLCVSSAIDVVSARHGLAPLSLVWQYDSSNDPFVPTHGVRARVDVEHASPLTGSAFGYNRATATVSRYLPINRSLVLAGRLRIGAVRALPGTNRRLGVSDPLADLVIHPRKYFFAGGSQSVRGYGENQLGPRVLTIDPAKLTDTSLSAPCAEASLRDGSCDPNAVGVSASDFQPRPLGGTAVAEGNLELRFPLWRSQGVSGALFVDGGIVGTRSFGSLLGSTGTITPGFGIRVDTPVGPVRVDLGVRPRVVERLPVITQVTEGDGSFSLVTLKTLRRFDQAEATGGVLKQVFSRLTLHIAIGPAF